MDTILITGGNRGIGLELVRQYAQHGWRVYATCRHPSEAYELKKIASNEEFVSVHRLDITIPEEISAIKSEIQDTPIDILFNNAGIYLEDDYRSPEPGAINYENWLRSFEVNTLGPVRMLEALQDNIARSNKRLIAVMTSHMGSISDIDTAGSYYYRSSKAALTASMRGFTVAMRSHGIGILLLHPGGVATRMGPDDGISPQQSVQGLYTLVEGFSIENTGSFLQYDGQAMPW